LKTFDLWVEGYSTTGQSAPAQFLGTYEGKTFREAVLSWSFSGLSRNENQYFNANNLTYWGCEIFDSEKKARKSFG